MWIKEETMGSPIVMAPALGLVVARRARRDDHLRHLSGAAVRLRRSVRPPRSAWPPARSSDSVTPLKHPKRWTARVRPGLTWSARSARVSTVGAVVCPGRGDRRVVRARARSWLAPPVGCSSSVFFLGLPLDPKSLELSGCSTLKKLVNGGRKPHPLAPGWS